MFGLASHICDRIHAIRDFPFWPVCHRKSFSCRRRTANDNNEALVWSNYVESQFAGVACTPSNRTSNLFFVRVSLHMQWVSIMPNTPYSHCVVGIPSARRARTSSSRLRRKKFRATIAIYLSRDGHENTKMHPNDEQWQRGASTPWIQFRHYQYLRMWKRSFGNERSG